MLHKQINFFLEFTEWKNKQGYTQVKNLFQVTQYVIGAGPSSLL